MQWHLGQKKEIKKPRTKPEGERAHAKLEEVWELEKSDHFCGNISKDVFECGKPQHSTETTTQEKEEESIRIHMVLVYEGERKRRH